MIKIDRVSSIIRMFFAKNCWHIPRRVDEFRSLTNVIYEAGYHVGFYRTVESLIDRLDSEEFKTNQDIIKFLTAKLPEIEADIAKIYSINPKEDEEKGNSENTK